MLLTNVKIEDRSAKAIKLMLKRGSNRRAVWLALSQIRMFGHELNKRQDIEVQDWLYHTAIEPLLEQAWVGDFNVPTHIPESRESKKIITNRGADKKEIADGIYTVAYPDGTHKTLRVNTSKRQKDFRIVSYLYGCDNTSDYKGIASPVGHELRFWKRSQEEFSFETLAAFRRAWEVICNNPQEAGEAYALESNHCYRCNRPLTVPASIHRGLGPECAKIVGAS